MPIAGTRRVPNDEHSSKNGRLGSVLSKVRSKIETVFDGQDELAEAREHVLVKREDIVTSRKALHRQRVRTGDAEIAFMDALRKFFVENSQSFPPELTVAYHVVADERDKLGSLEEDHLQVARDLGELEWEFGEQENEFYQYNLRQHFSDDFWSTLNDGDDEPEDPSSKPDVVSPSTPMQYQAAIVELNQLRRRFRTMRQERANKLDNERILEPKNANPTAAGSGDPDFVTAYSDLLTEISVCEVKIQYLKGELSYHVLPNTTRLRRHSEPNCTRPSIPDGIPTRAHSDAEVPILSDDLSIQHRIRDWLLDCLKKSAVERTQYLNILKHNVQSFGAPEPDYTHWEELAAQHWPFDMIESSLLPDPKSVPSPHNSSQQIAMSQVSNIAEQRLSDRIIFVQPLTGSVVARDGLCNEWSTSHASGAGDRVQSALVSEVPGVSEASPELREGSFQLRITSDDNFATLETNATSFFSNPTGHVVGRSSSGETRRREPPGPTDFLGTQFQTRIDSAYNSDIEESSPARFRACTPQQHHEDTLNTHEVGDSGTAYQRCPPTAATPTATDAQVARTTLFEHSEGHTRQLQSYALPSKRHAAKSRSVSEHDPRFRFKVQLSPTASIRTAERNGESWRNHSNWLPVRSASPHRRSSSIPDSLITGRSCGQEDSNSYAQLFELFIRS